MPLDTRIALGVQPLQLADPLAREGQVQNILASQAQQRAAGIQQQSAQMQMDQTQRQLQQDEDYVNQMKDAIGKNGGPPDMEKAARLMATNRNPDVSRQGVTMLQSLQRLAAAKLAGIYGAPAPVIPNAGPTPGAMGSGTFGMDQNVPMFNQPNVPPLNLAAPAPAVNQLTPPAAPPVNQLAAAPQADVAKTLQAEFMKLSQFTDLPGVTDRMNLIKEQLKELSTRRVVGRTLVTGGGDIIFTAPQDVTLSTLATLQNERQALIDSGALPNDPRVKYYDAAINKETTRAPGTVVNIDNKQEGAFATGLGKGQSDRILANQVVAQDAAAILETNQVGRNLLKAGAITGTGADFLVGFNNALKQAGVDFGYADAASNSQAYAAAMGANVGRIIKQFGAGTGLSDADREYAAQMAGGKISLTEASLRKILEINDRAANRVIDLHNKNVSGIKTNIPLTVEKPTFAAPAPSGANLIPGSTPAAPASNITQQRQDANAAIAKGAPAAAVRQRFKQNTGQEL